ncbi:CaiB/BaiF CoA transferase family protein [Mycolicibacterium sp. XJ1819]
MHRPLTGVRVLEVAQFTFVPSAGAVLADWGAEVIKVENPVTGDGQRGLATVLGHGTGVDSAAFAPVIEAPNRGKRSIGLELAVMQARPVLEELIRRSDVFLTNYLPTARAKLRIDVDEVRRINPDIIYVTGSGFGTEGPDREAGAYDSTAFWARGGSADGVTPSGAEQAAYMPAGGYGDNIGGLAIAGGVAAALYGRKMTGEPSVLDVSLLAVGAWATQFSVNMALQAGGPLPKLDDTTQAPCNPLTGNYRTADGRYIQLAMLQPTRHWPEFCRLMDCAQYAFDPRFATLEALVENLDDAIEIVRSAIGSRSLAECARLLDQGTGPWSVVQNAWDVGTDASLIANGRIAEVVDCTGESHKLVANPVKFDHGALNLRRAPRFAEHTDDVLRELGFDEDTLTELKFAGAIT